MAHISSCPSLACIYLYQSTHNIIHKSYLKFRCTRYFHHTRCLVKYTSAPFSSLAPTDDFPPASLYTLYHGLYIFTGVSPAHQCACPTTFASKYRSVLDGSRTTSSDKPSNIYGQVQSRPEYTLNTCKTPQMLHYSPPAQTCSTQGAI